ncbi:hypothetical protein ACFV24_24190 [Nocardia fluminea]|uniref:hypothetical protein n=1 Tax=Nocardia fluminea TaxID=134984 RepID=UPI00366F6EAF
MGNRFASIKDSTVIGLLAIASLALAVGCSPESASPQPSGVTPQPSGVTSVGITAMDLCTALNELFVRELHALELRAEVGSGESSGAPFSDEASCGLRQGNNDGQSGIIGMKRTSEGSLPAEEWRREDYKELTGLGERIWVDDVTADPVWSDFPRISYVTRIGEWNGSVSVFEYATDTVDGKLRLSDENKRKVADFIIDWTRRVADGRPK